MTGFIAIFLSAAAAAGFTPPVDRPLTLVSRIVRDDGRTVRRYRLERELVFSAEPGGYRVVMTLRRAAGESAGSQRDMFAAANAPLVGRPIVLHLATDGTLRSIDDLDAVWADWSAGMNGMTKAPARQQDVAPLVARALAWPDAQKAAAVAAPVLALVAPPDERSPQLPRPMRMMVGRTTLEGVTESATTPAGLVRVVSRAEGRDSVAGMIAVVFDRTIDAATGRVVRSIRSEQRTLDGGQVLRTEISGELSDG